MQVVPGSAAERAGIKGGNQRVYYGNYEIIIGGDLIVEIDGQPVKDNQDLAHLMNNHRSGDSVTIVYYHGKKRQTARVNSTKPKPEPAARHFAEAEWPRVGALPTLGFLQRVRAPQWIN